MKAAYALSYPARNKIFYTSDISRHKPHLPGCLRIIFMKKPLLRTAQYLFLLMADKALKLPDDLLVGADSNALPQGF